MKVIDIAHHRNGSGGDPFSLVTFTDWDRAARPSSTYLAVIPDDQRYAPPHALRETECYVTEIDLLPDTAFGVNSFRGDVAWTDLIAAGLWADDRYVVTDGQRFWSRRHQWTELARADYYTRSSITRAVLPPHGTVVHWEQI